MATVRSAKNGLQQGFQARFSADSRRSPFSALQPAKPRKELAAARSGIQSLDQGLRVMQLLAHSGSALRLKDLAAKLGMSSSKAHRYLTSLVKAGWAAQDDTAYTLGYEAIAMAAACLNRVSAVRMGGSALAKFAQKTGRTAGLAVWGAHGPTIVMIEESADPVSMNIRPGTSVPVLCSATGMIFAAFGPPSKTATWIADELHERPRRHAFRSAAALGRSLDEIRLRRWASVNSSLVPGVSAVAAPVFDHRGRLEAVLLSIGPDSLPLRAGSGDAATKSVIAVLLDVTAELSRSLGYLLPDRSA